MEELPVEVLSEIFSYLSVAEFLSVAEVSEVFYSVINAKVFMDKICANFTDCENFRNSTRRYVRLKIEQAQDEQLELCHRMLSQQAAPIKSSARFLKFDDIEIISEIPLRNLLTNFNNVIELELGGIYTKFDASPPTSCAIPFPHLKILKFFYSTNSLLHLFSDIKDQIETFKVCLVPHDNDLDRNRNYRVVTQILQNNRFKLRKLNLYEVNFDDDFLEQISSIKFTRLNKFAMSFNSYLGPESLGFEKFVKNQAETLQKFKIRTFDHIKQHQLEVLTRYAVNLRSLNLIICSFCDYDNFTNFIILRNLEKLKIQPTNFCGAGDSRYEMFVNEKILNHRNVTMKSVTIESLGISREIISKIIASFPNVEILKLSSHSEFPTDIVKLLKDKLKNLRILELKNNFIINKMPKI